MGQAVTIVVESQNGHNAVGCYEVGGDRFGAVQMGHGQYAAVRNALSGQGSGIAHSFSECSTGLHENGWYRIRCTFAVNELTAGIQEGGDFRENEILDDLASAAHSFQYARNY